MNGIDVRDIWLRPSDIAGLPGYPSKPWNVTVRAEKEGWPFRPARGAEDVQVAVAIEVRERAGGRPRRLRQHT